MIIKILLLWLPMIAIAFANATIRELVLVKHFTELRAHQISTVTLIIFCFGYVWFIFRFLDIHLTKHALLVGGLWVLLTIIFEFSLGRFNGKSWESLFLDYNLLKGRIWLLFLISLFFLPYLALVLKGGK